MSKSITSPKGVARYPYLNTPDTKFNPDGDYKVGLVLEPGEETDAFVAKLEAAMEASVAKAKKENPGKKIKVADLSMTTDEDTGKVTVNFKMKAKVTTKAGKTFEQKPALFDAKGKPMSDKRVGGGSVIKVAFDPTPFYTATVGAGVTLRLQAVQVISLNSGGNRDASGFGFGAEEGYEDDGVPASPFENEEGDSQEDSSGDATDF
jgi:hypothetical protein